MKNKIKERFTWFILLALITSFSIQSLSLLEFSSKVGDFSLSVSSLSTQDMLWPPDSSEWTEVAPETQGLDSDKITEMFEFIETNTYDIHSVIITRNGYLLTEEYLFNSQLIESNTYPEGIKTHAQWSTTKSLMSILIGIALQEGFLDNLSQTLYEFFAHMWISNFTNSTLKKSITIEQLLTMTSGIGDFDIPDASLKIAADCITFILDEVPLAATPGEVRQYSNEGVDLLSGIITNATGKSTVEFAKEYLFTPLGIEENEYNWLHDAQNSNYGGSGLECTPKVQAKLGMLCLNNGTWNGTQIIDSNYIKSATIDQYIGLISYGYLFYVSPPISPFGGYNSYGAAGQAIYVIPEYDIVVGFTANSDIAPYEAMILSYILQFTEDNAPEGDGNQIPGFDFNMIVLMIFCTSALLIIKKKKHSKN